MKDYRCARCTRLLLKADNEALKGQLQIKCPRCKFVNTFSLKEARKAEGLTGKQQYERRERLVNALDAHHETTRL